MTPSRSGRRIAALVSGLGLAAGSLLVAPVAPAAAAPPNDSAAAVAGGDWLVSQLTDGSIVNDQFDFTDWGLTLDTGLALQEYGDRYEAELAEVTEATTSPEGVRSYTTFDDFDIPGVRLAGESAKLLSYAIPRGVDPQDVGGVDLLAELESLVATDAPIAGRIVNRTTADSGPDNANALGQGFAARALTVAGSEQADASMDFFLDQQCDAGFFRVFLTPSATAEDQTCQGGVSAGDSAASPDATGIAVLNLLATDPAPGSEASVAVEDAVDWLLDEQADDGSFTGGAGPTDTPNTNSTGVAGWALGAVGEDAAATAAGAWVAGRQVAGFEACEGALTPEQDGAVAYDDAAFERGIQEGIVVETRDQWRRASAQALPALRSLPERTAQPDLSTSGDNARYVRADRPQRFTVRGLAAGQKVCLTGPGGSSALTYLPESGPSISEVTTSLRLPKGSGTRTYRLAGFEGSVSIDALGTKRFDVRRAKNAVARGARQTVTVRGLAPREKVTVRLRGKVVDTGVATTAGFFRSSFVVRGKTGRAALKVIGQFAATRFGTKGFTVR